MINYLTKIAVRTRQDGGISITRFAIEDMVKYGYVDDEAFIAWYMNRIAPGEPFTIMQEDAVPKDRSQRGAWSINGDKIEVDPVKLAAAQEKEDAKVAVLGKLGIAKEDIPALRAALSEGAE